MPYIDTKYLGKCETCRNHRSGGCNTYCDHGEEYSPNVFKIPTADVVPRAEYEALKIELEAMRGAANSYKLHYERLAKEIFAEIEKLLRISVAEHSDCLDDYVKKGYAELKEKYTKGDEGE